MLNKENLNRVSSFSKHIKLNLFFVSKNNMLTINVTLRYLQHLQESSGVHGSGFFD